MNTPLHRFASILFSLFAALTLSAAVSADIDAAEVKFAADSAYTDRHYVQAAQQYALLADSLESADLYYNLGNAEFRLKHFPQAVLAYQRALRIDPGHDDARYNLEIVRTRLEDRFSKPSEMFFISWVREWVTSRSVETWSGWSLLWLVLFFAGLAFYYVGGRMWLRKCGFFAALLFAIFFIFVTVFSFIQRYRYYHDNDAVVIADEVQLYASPTKSSKKLQQIHGGTTFEILDTPTEKWLNIALPDGSEAYMPATGYKKVME